MYSIKNLTKIQKSDNFIMKKSKALVLSKDPTHRRGKTLGRLTLEGILTSKANRASKQRNHTREGSQDRSGKERTQKAPVKTHCPTRLADITVKRSSKSNSVAKSLKLQCPKTIPNTTIVSPGERVGTATRKTRRRHNRQESSKNASFESLSTFHNVVRIYGNNTGKLVTGKNAGQNKSFDLTRTKKKSRAKPVTNENEVQVWRSYEFTEDVRVVLSVGEGNVL